MKNIIIGTAGHIDHGKTTLIKALTGRNTDRWEEEQRRGITIDLGFTYFDLPGGDRAGIIDVPGHEKFINNMVAGVVGMDLVLLVIAADEGIMPQTREHMDILNLLGIEKSIIVLNKCDLVDEEWLEMMEEDVRKSNSTFYTNNFEAVSRWRKKYLSEYAPIPEFKTNIYIYGPGGIGKTVASQAAAKSLFPDAVNPYFQTFAETRNLKWYDGQPVIIWDNCMSSDLLRMFGRQKLFDILDTQPTDTKCKTNSGSVRLVNSINIINSMAVQKQRLGERKQALRIWMQLSDYLEVRKVDDEEKEKVYPMILYNEANLLYEMEIYREALELCNKGIDYCTRSNKYMVLPYLLLCKSGILKWMEQPEEAMDVQQCAEHLFQVFENHNAKPGEPILIAL